MPVDVFANRQDQLLDITEDSAAEPILRKVAEETLDHVEPRTAGRSEVDVESPVLSQPVLYLGMFVGGIVIRNQVDFLTTWYSVNHP